MQQGPARQAEKSKQAEPQLSMRMRGDRGVTGCVWAARPKGISQQPDTRVSKPFPDSMSDVQQVPLSRWSEDKSLRVFHRVHLPGSLGARLWPIWSLSAPVTQKGGDCKAAMASVLSTSPRQPHMPVQWSRHISGHPSLHITLPSGQGQRDPDTTRKKKKNKKNQV